MPAFLANTAYNMLVYARQCRRSASSAGSVDKSVGSADKSVGSADKSVGSADKSAGSVDKSAGSVDKSAGTLHLHTLRNALKIN